MNRDISTIRRDYNFKDLLEGDIPTNPLLLFDEWLEQAIESCPSDPTAMILSTVDTENAPHSRVVLLKQRDSSGFVFFTNYESNKGKDIITNNQACITFFWPELSRQIRIEGHISKVDRMVSESYFQTRPKGSQIAATASPQSQKISREDLHSCFATLEQEYKQQAIPCPENWGGYKLAPNYIEFWQGRPSRLHDRLCYTLEENNEWSLHRKAP